jgi:hypothetical protein
MDRPDEVTWPVMHSAKISILNDIRIRNAFRANMKLLVRKIPPTTARQIIEDALAAIWSRRKNPNTNLSVDKLLDRLVIQYAREYIERHLEWWYGELDNDEMLRPGSKSALIKLVFEE